MRKILFILVLIFLHPSLSYCQTVEAVKQLAPASHKVDLATQSVDPTVLSNQMMITIMERMKAGNYPEAKKIALDMILDCDKYVDTPENEYRSFATLMEKKLYEIYQAREGKKGTVHWVQQPIADGFYFLAMIAFQEQKLEEAKQYLQKAINWDPMRSAFYMERAYFMIANSETSELAMVMASYLKALELADNFEDFAAAMRGLGYVFVDKGDIEAGLACYLVSLTFEPANMTAKKEIDYIRSLNPELVKSLDASKSAAILSERKVPSRMDTVHIKVLLSIADEPSVQKRPKELKAILKQALLLDPNNVEVKNRLAVVK